MGAVGVPAYDLPDYAVRVLSALESAGFEAWVVGGWVRDALLGAPSHDVDVTTSAHWRQTASCLRAAGITVHETGTKHGTVTAVLDGRRWRSPPTGWRVPTATSGIPTSPLRNRRARGPRAPRLHHQCHGVSSGSRAPRPVRWQGGPREGAHPRRGGPEAPLWGGRPQGAPRGAVCVPHGLLRGAAHAGGARSLRPGARPRRARARGPGARWHRRVGAHVLGAPPRDGGDGGGHPPGGHHGGL